MRRQAVRKIVFLGMLCLSAQSCSGVPSQGAADVPSPKPSVGYAPVALEGEQPDGHRFVYFRRGGIGISWMETQAGYTILRNPSDRSWYFARCNMGRLEPSSIKVGERLPADWPKHLRPIAGCGVGNQ